jgi:hypothetical protein
MSYTKDSLKKYEEFLEDLKLHPELFRNKEVEMDLKGILNPSNILNEFFFIQNKWMSFAEFNDYYFEKYKVIILERFNFHSFNDFKEGLRARLYRTQFGFLTEYHAFFLASIIFGNSNVKRSVELDKSGVDFQIILNGGVYNIHIFVDTDRSWKFRNYKSRFKSVDSIPGIHTNLPYALSSNRFNSLRYLLNKFGVYTESYLHYFENEALKGKIKDCNIIGTTLKGFTYA